MGYFKKLNAFLEYAMCYHETGYDKQCSDKSVGESENDLQHSFVEHWLNWPYMFLWVAVFALVSSRPLPSEKIAPLAAQVKSPFCDSCLYVCYYVFLNFKAIGKQKVFVQSLTSM